jgi:hypothetical protein
MMRKLAMAAQGFALLVGATVGIHPSPLPILLAVLVGAALLAPFVGRLAGGLARALAAVWHGPTDVPSADDVPDFVVPPAPGTPGTTLARAPGYGVHAFA